jgi:hypothetical protein
VGKGKKVTIGYTYYMSLLMGIGRPISELVQINVGDKLAWKGPLCRPSSGFYINARNLFGGDDKEGGIQGPGAVLWGGSDQQLPGPQTISGKTLPGVKETISRSTNVPIPALRGVTSIWYDGEVCSMNPYPKEWKFRVRRHIHGWYGDRAWYPAKAVIYLSGSEVVTYKDAQALGDAFMAIFLSKGGSKTVSKVLQVPSNIKAMNGAHIIYQCATDPEWGRGLPPELIDENSFIYAANTLCAEGFGLCFNWQREEDVDAFIQIVLDHIGGALYTDRSTGLLTLRLIRADYDPATIPTFSIGSGLLDILEDDSGSSDLAANEVVVKWHSPIDDTDGTSRAHNVGARLAQGAAVSVSKDYPGIPTADLAARVAARDLVVQSGALKRYKVRLDRSGWRIAPAMPFRIVCPERGIGSIILRAGDIADSSAQQGGDIQITAMEDVFGLPLTGMQVEEQSSWTPPVSDPVAPPASAAFELSYYDLTKRLSQFELPQVDDEDAYLGMVAAQPVSTMLNYDLLVDPGPDGTFADTGTFSFTGHAVLAEDVGYFDTEITLADVTHFPNAADLIGDCVMVGEERMRLDSFNAATGVMTVARGVIDTLPQKHAKGASLFLPDDDTASDGTVYAMGETIDVVAATRTTSAVLTPEDYDVKTVTIMQRVGRPYPVANLKVDGQSVFEASGLHPEPVFTWATRNRVTQQDQLIGYTEGSVVEEDGTTYEVVIMDRDGVVIATHDLPAGSTTYTYDAATQAADGSPRSILVDVRPVRAGLRPLYPYAIPLPVVLVGGWGYTWGLNWS